MIRFFQWLAAAIMVVAAGCATTPKVDWEARVGSYTYDEAVLELGPPENVAELQNGTKVAEWAAGGRRGGSSVMVGVGPVISAFPVGEERRDYLRLTFGAEGRLTGHQRVVK